MEAIILNLGALMFRIIIMTDLYLAVIFCRLSSSSCRDDDMQSTFSAVSAGMESMTFDEDDEDEEVVERKGVEDSVVSASTHNDTSSGYETSFCRLSSSPLLCCVMEY